MLKYKIFVPLELDMNKCDHCGLRFTIIAPWESESGEENENRFLFQTYNFCPYCGKPPMEQDE